jgi:hypothetical protein
VTAAEVAAAAAPPLGLRWRCACCGFVNPWAAQRCTAKWDCSCSMLRPKAPYCKGWVAAAAATENARLRAAHPELLA